MESEIYWLQQTEADVPPGDDWLSGGERAILEGLRYAKRRADWRLGRWSAKCAAAAYLKSSIPPTCLAEIEVYALPSGAPQVVLPNGLAPVAISLSHRNSIGMCAIGRPDTAIGCDLEIVEAHSTAFMRDYFTEEEEWEIAQAPAGSRQTFVAVLWSAKESTLKALQEGLRLDTRSVSVRLGSRADEISTGIHCRFAANAVSCSMAGGNRQATWCAPWWPDQSRECRCCWRWQASRSSDRNPEPLEEFTERKKRFQFTSSQCWMRPLSWQAVSAGSPAARRCSLRALHQAATAIRADFVHGHGAGRAEGALVRANQRVRLRWESASAFLALGFHCESHHGRSKRSLMDARYLRLQDSSLPPRSTTMYSPLLHGSTSWILVRLTMILR